MKTKLALFFCVPCLMLAGCHHQPEEWADDFINSNPEGEKIVYKMVINDGDDAMAEDFLYYTDDYFAEPAETLNISFSNASFGLVQGSTPNVEEKDYALKSETGKKLFHDLHFVDVTSNLDYQQEPTENSIGAIFGHKQINIEDKSYQLIAIAIRSNNYELEWLNNFLIGEVGDHQGFAQSSEKLFQDIDNYLTEYHISGPVKMWITGHSRGANVVNLLGGKLDKAIKLEQKLFTQDVTYSKNDLYIQCFNPSMVAYSTEPLNGDEYINIQCFTSFSDLTNYVPSASYGFNRYGKTYYLPSYITGGDYASAQAIYRRYYNEYTNLKDLLGEAKFAQLIPYKYNGSPLLVKPVEDTSKLNWSIEIFLKDLSQILFDEIVVSRENYVDNFQDSLLKALRYILTKYQIVDLFEQDILELVSEIVDNAFDSDEEANAFYTTIMGAFMTLMNKHPDILATLRGGDLSAFIFSHLSATARIWFKIMDPNYLREPLTYDMTSSYRRITLINHDDGYFTYTLNITNENGDKLVQFNQGQPKTIKDSTIPYGLYSNRCVIYLPMEEQYTLNIVSPNSDSEVDYTLEDYSIIKNDYIINVAMKTYSLTKGQYQEIVITK